MQDYWLTQYALKATGIGILLICLVVIVLALWLPKTRRGKGIALAAVLIALSVPASKIYERAQTREQAQTENRQRYEVAKAHFEERCKTAGEKIYKTVEGVEGIRLLNIRADGLYGNEANQYWSGAGFPKESSGNEYIMKFLYHHHVPENNQSLHTLRATSGGLRGYRYLDVEEGSQRFRYTLRAESEYVTAADPVKAHGQRSMSDGPSPRYAVGYEDIQDPEGRAHWIAGNRVTVIDTTSGELLGEFIQYSFETGFGSRAGNRQPWAFARQCPEPNLRSTTAGHVRFFVEKVLKPKQGE
ncbi:hypothetical protein [Hydrogenophaga sp.]|uniref:hypothetical protein n=1 Tax=Hydrogenophaga sp. TaxID=1904254 RepID=UPI003D0BB938